jgi:heat shock protein HtpX
VYNANGFKTVLSGAIFTLFFLWIGQLVAGWTGLLVALAVAVLMAAALAQCTGAAILRLHGAQELDERDDPELFLITRHLAQRLNLPSPRLYLMPEESPNAFAAGCTAHDGAIVLTTGLRRALNRDEQAGVIAHELAHLKKGDTRIMILVALLAGAPYLVNKALQRLWVTDDNQADTQIVRGLRPGCLDGWVRQMVMPIVTLLVRCHLQGAQEFDADELAAWVTGEPLALSSALQKMETALQQTPMRWVTPATAHLFIINPYSSQGRMWISQTHPPTAERVVLLEDLAYQQRDHGFAA